MFTRNCRSCGKVLEYKTRSHLNLAEKRGSGCRPCMKGRLGTKLSDETKAKLRDATKRQLATLGHPLTGMSPSIVTRTKLRTARLAQVICPQTVARQAEILARYNKSPEGRRKSRIRMIERAARTGLRFHPGYNRDACKLFDEINEVFGWAGKHALNGGEVHLEKLGYFLDYYDSHLNLVIEFDERHHQKQITADRRREDEIVQHLGCEFIRIRDGQSFTDIVEIISDRMGLKV